MHEKNARDITLVLVHSSGREGRGRRGQMTKKETACNDLSFFFFLPSVFFSSPGSTSDAIKSQQKNDRMLICL